MREDEEDIEAIDGLVEEGGEEVNTSEAGGTTIDSKEEE